MSTSTGDTTDESIGENVGENSGDSQAKREYGQLLRLHRRVANGIRRLLDELRAPGTDLVLKQIRRRTGSSPAGSLGRVTNALEEAVRTVVLSESEIQQEFEEEHEEAEVEGITNLPPSLARFLAERSEDRGFRYEVLQDPVRGWIIRWTEYTIRGEIRGGGQFYERPYAWLEE